MHVLRRHSMAAALLCLLAFAGQTADKGKTKRSETGTPDLRGVVYNSCAPWAIHGLPDKGKLVFVERVGGRPVVVCRSIDSRSLLGKAKLFQVRVLNKKFVETTNGPMYIYRGLVVRDDHVAVLHTEKDILTSIGKAEIKKVDDVALLCRLFSDMQGMSLEAEAPTDGKPKGIIPEDVQKKTDWSVTIRKMNNGWQASFAAVDIQSYRVVRYVLQFGPKSATVTKKTIVWPGLTFI